MKMFSCFFLLPSFQMEELGDTWHLYHDYDQRLLSHHLRRSASADGYGKKDTNVYCVYLLFGDYSLIILTTNFVLLQHKFRTFEHIHRTCGGSLTGCKRLQAKTIDVRVGQGDVIEG